MSIVITYEFVCYSQSFFVCVFLKLQLGGVALFFRTMFTYSIWIHFLCFGPSLPQDFNSSQLSYILHTHAFWGRSFSPRKYPWLQPPPWREQKRTNWFVCCLSCQDRPRLGFGQREGLYVWVIQMLRQGPEISRLWVQLVDITGDLRQQLLLLGLWHPPKPDGYRGRGMTGWIIGSLLWLCIVLSPALVPTV